MVADEDWIGRVKAQMDPTHTKLVRAEGALAFKNGKDWSDNPYVKHDLDYGQWGRGWLDAELEARQQPRVTGKERSNPSA